MCLEINKNLTEEYLAKNVNKEEVVVWKVLRKEQKNGMPIYFAPCMNNEVKVGREYKAKGLANNKKKSSTIDHGIHVHLTRESAREYRVVQDEVIFRCIAKKKDILACGNDSEAVFTKIFIPATPSR